MEFKNSFINQIAVIIAAGLLVGISVSIFSIPSPIFYIILLIGLLLIPLFIYLGIIHRGALPLFILFSSFGIMHTPIKPFDLLFVVVAGLFFILKKNKYLSIMKIRFIHFALMLFIVVSLLSVINSQNFNLGISYFIHTLFVISIFYFLTLTIQKEKEFHAIIWGYICTVLISVFAVAAEKSGIVGYMGTWFQGVRAQGFFIDPNDFSPFLVLAVLILLNQAFGYHYFSFKYTLFCTTSSLVLVTLLASMSRAATLNLIIAISVYLLYTLTHKKKVGQVLVYLGLLSIFAIMALIVAGDVIINHLSIRFFGSTEVLQQYDIDRFYYQLQGLIMGSTHLFGIGPGQFEYKFGYATHNLFVRIISENGWAAFILFAAVNLYIFTFLIKFRKYDVWNLPVYLFLAVYMGMMVNSFFLDTLHWRYLWFILGLCVIILNQAAKK